MRLDKFNNAVRITLTRDEAVKLHKAMRFLLSPLEANSKKVDFQFVGDMKWSTRSHEEESPFSRYSPYGPYGMWA